MRYLVNLVIQYPVHSRSYQRASESGHLPTNPLGSGYTVDQTAGRCVQCHLPLHTGKGAAQGHLVRGTGGEYSTALGGYLRTTGELEGGSECPRWNPTGDGTKVGNSLSLVAEH